MICSAQVLLAIGVGNDVGAADGGAEMISVGSRVAGVRAGVGGGVSAEVGGGVSTGVGGGVGAVVGGGVGAGVGGGVGTGVGDVGAGEACVEMHT